MNKEQEIEIFEEACMAAHTAEQKIAVLSAELIRHLTAIQDETITRTSEMQATLSLEEIETIFDELKKVNEALLRILLKSGEK